MGAPLGSIARMMIVMCGEDLIFAIISASHCHRSSFHSIIDFFRSGDVDLLKSRQGHRQGECSRQSLSTFYTVHIYLVIIDFFKIVDRSYLQTIKSRQWLSKSRWGLSTLELLRRHDKYIYIESDKGLGPQQYLRPKNADGENDVSNLVSTFDSATSTLDKSRCCAVTGRHRLIYFHLRSVSTFRLSSTVQ